MHLEEHVEAFTEIDIGSINLPYFGWRVGGNLRDPCVPHEPSSSDYNTGSSKLGWQRRKRQRVWLATKWAVREPSVKWRNFELLSGGKNELHLQKYLTKIKYNARPTQSNIDLRSSCMSVCTNTLLKILNKNCEQKHSKGRALDIVKYVTNSS